MEECYPWLCLGESVGVHCISLGFSVSLKFFLIKNWGIKSPGAPLYSTWVQQGACPHPPVLQRGSGPTSVLP